MFLLAVLVVGGSLNAAPPLTKAGLIAVAESPVTKVVSLLQEMLDASKSDGEADREAYATFKCYCDSNVEDKTAAIANATATIELMTAALAERRAQNQQLSQEVYTLSKQMADNEQARSEADNMRQKETADYEQEAADLETGLSQLGKAIKLLQAVGADGTEASSTELEELPSLDTGLLAKSARLSTVSKEMQAALSAASVFLTGAQRKKMTSFLAVRAPGNYNAQSGEIVGILKSMNDTFATNLAHAHESEAKAQGEFDGFMEVKEEEFNEMKEASDSKKEVIGNNAAEIATTSSELATKEEELEADQNFISELAPRCEAAKGAYDSRNTLRANEEAAVAQAIAILHSDSARDTFAASSTKEAFLQLRVVRKAGGVRAAAQAGLAKAAQHSRRVARVSAILAAGNPFEQVLAKIREVIELIDKEEVADDRKKAWCDTEQSENEANKEDKTTDVQTLETNIANLGMAVEQSKTNIQQATDDLSSNRDAQTQETDMRKDSHAVFATSLGNLQEAEKIVTKAMEVLTKFYKLIKEQQEEAKELSMVAKRHAAFMKERAAMLAKEQALKHGKIVLLQEEPMASPEFSKSQEESGNSVIGLLEHILTETKAEAGSCIEAEKSAQGQFETNMQALKSAEQGLNEALEKYGLDLATTEKRAEQAHENKDVTRRELEAIERYLASIEPDCTFIISNLQERKDSRAAEKAALEGAVSTLEASPAFQTAEDSQERTDLGKCADICDGKKDTDTAQCQACQDGVTVAGYCATKDAPGCADATKTGSAAAMNAP